MRFVSLDACTRIVAAALLVASAFSVGLRHAHPGGNLAHDHHVAHNGHTHIAHDGHRHTAHDHHPADSAAHFIVDAAQSHMHVYLLGFEFTVPTENNQDDPSDRDSQGGTNLCVTRLAGADFDASSRAVVIDWLDTPDQDNALALPDLAPDECAMIAMAAIATPLCDSARRERTGVLRI